MHKERKNFIQFHLASRRTFSVSRGRINRHLSIAERLGTIKETCFLCLFPESRWSSNHCQTTRIGEKGKSACELPMEESAEDFSEFRIRIFGFEFRFGGEFYSFRSSDTDTGTGIRIEYLTGMKMGIINKYEDGGYKIRFKFDPLNFKSVVFFFLFTSNFDGRSARPHE